MDVVNKSTTPSRKLGVFDLVLVDRLWGRGGLIGIKAFDYFVNIDLGVFSDRIQFIDRETIGPPVCSCSRYTHCFYYVGERVSMFL